MNRLHEFIPRSLWISNKYGRNRKVTIRCAIQGGKRVSGWINGKVEHEWDAEAFLGAYTPWKRSVKKT